MARKISVEALSRIKKHLFFAHKKQTEVVKKLMSDIYTGKVQPEELYIPQWQLNGLAQGYADISVEIRRLLKEKKDEQKNV